MPLMPWWLMEGFGGKTRTGMMLPTLQRFLAGCDNQRGYRRQAKFAQGRRCMRALRRFMVAVLREALNHEGGQGSKIDLWSGITVRGPKCVSLIPGSLRSLPLCLASLALQTCDSGTTTVGDVNRWTFPSTFRWALRRNDTGKFGVSFSGAANPV